MAKLGGQRLLCLCHQRRSTGLEGGSRINESTNDDGVAFGTQVEGRYYIHKLVVEQYVKDCMMLTSVDADGESDTRIENSAHGLAILFSLETSGYMPTPTTYTV